jgi:hypothetical protein
MMCIRTISLSSETKSSGIFYSKKDDRKTSVLQKLSKLRATPNSLRYIHAKSSARFLSIKTPLFYLCEVTT